ncbi:MAG TPA: ADP-glyceromanno-heptose 6-epimerase [Chitinophagaceae bacterium]|nr:ADP-glyceromanno-heptose 6-epimerase [Chitinophagaceae bacterium]
MNSNHTIVITGAAGFIGSCLTGFLGRKGMDRLILVDDFSRADKSPNLEGKAAISRVDRERFFRWLEQENPRVDAFFHLGARTDTTDPDFGIFERLNLEYSRKVWQWCAAHQVPLVYASSAATYGNGDAGYEDREEDLPKLHPLNPYGSSKHQFDLWAVSQTRSQAPPFWAGLKFFNVYGPNEYHKGRMASVVFHAHRQIHETGKVRLFRSHLPAYRDGEQLRDFIYVEDVLETCFWLMDTRPTSGIYNLGTGKARTFNDLASAVFSALHAEPRISYMDMPADIRDNYQYFTEAKMEKLQEAGYHNAFTSLEQGVEQYVNGYLEWMKYY